MCESHFLDISLKMLKMSENLLPVPAEVMLIIFLSIYIYVYVNASLINIVSMYWAQAAFLLLQDMFIMEYIRSSLAK